MWWKHPAGAVRRSSVHLKWVSRGSGIFLWFLYINTIFVSSISKLENTRMKVYSSIQNSVGARKTVAQLHISLRMRTHSISNKNSKIKILSYKVQQKQITNVNQQKQTLNIYVRHKTWNVKVSNTTDSFDICQLDSCVWLLLLKLDLRMRNKMYSDGFILWIESFF